VLLGVDPPVNLTKRALDRLAQEREEKLHLVHPGGNVIVRDKDGDLRWWTWAGFRTNVTLTSTLGQAIDPVLRFDDCSIRLREDLTPRTWSVAAAQADGRLCLPQIDERALKGLKFSAALPKRLAVATLAARSADLEGAAAILRQPTRFVSLA
jgi:ATP-dependent Lhr-like helicase